MTWFNNATLFRLTDAPDAIRLSEALSKRPFQPCAGLDWFSEGWVAPATHLEEPVFSTRGHMLVKLLREDKVLPAAVIRKTVDAKVAEIEAKELRKVGRKEKLALKEQITDDLLPRAFTKPTRVPALIAGGWLIADTGSAPRAEGLVSKLREALPPFPAALPRTKIAPHTAMTDWLAAGEAPGAFELGADAVLKDCGENGATVKVSRIDLTSDEIRQHIATGKQVTTLGLIWNEKICFKLTDTMQLKSIQFLDLLQDEASQAGDDRESLFAATFLLMSEELGELVEALVEALGGLEDSQQLKEAA
ncbi:recombination-associated protein RdgC [Chromobacterium haemolyticum]|uniref:recombination-associated protein RdgC n=1 Tax=Chromobacterium TaxID=535 RepID=UPI004056EAB7